jgi:hypothetical protein
MFNMPTAPTGYLADGSEEQMALLSKKARTAVENAIVADGINPDKPIMIVVADGVTTIENVTIEQAEEGRASSSIDEINAVLSDGLPEAYTRDAQSQSEDGIWADHLSGNWGF